MKKTEFSVEKITGGEEVIHSAWAESSVPIGQIVFLSILAIVTIACDGFLIGSEVISTIVSGQSWRRAIVFIIALFLHLVPEGVWAAHLAKEVSSAKNLFYIVTPSCLYAVYNLPVLEVRRLKFDSAQSFSYKNGKLTFNIGGDVVTFKGLELSEKVIEKIVVAPEEKAAEDISKTDKN
jgi:hypothetical protein